MPAFPQDNSLQHPPPATEDRSDVPETEAIAGQDEIASPLAQTTLELLSEHPFQALFEAALEAIVIADDQGSYVAANQAACDLFGLTRAELVGCSLKDFTPADIDADQAWISFLQQGQARGEFPLMRADGTMRQVEYAATANVMPHRHLSILRDVTEQRALAQQLHQLNQSLEQQVAQRTSALEQANADLRSFLNNSPACIVKFRLFADGRVAYDYYSSKSESMYGYPAAVLLNQPDLWQSRVLPEDLEAVIKPVIAAIMAGQTQLGAEYRFRHADGSMRWIREVATAEWHQAQNCWTVVSVATDISDRKRLEAEAAQRHQQLQQQQLAMLELFQRQELYSGDLAMALRYITETAAQTLQLDRVSVWWLQAETPLLVCADLFCRDQNRHLTLPPFSMADYPIYFRAMVNNRIIAADDAHQDPRTQEFAQTYIRSEGIVSMMDVPIRSEGQLIGVLCFDQTHAPHPWRVEEQHFAIYLASLVALVKESGDRRLAEKQLTQREQEFRALAENTPDCILRCDRQYRFLYANPAVAALNQLPQAAILGKTPQELGFPDILTSRWQGAFERAFTTGQTQTLDYTMALPTGPKTFDSRIVPEFDGDGRVETVLIVARDITDLRRAQEDSIYQAEQERTLRLITQHIRQTLHLDDILEAAVSEIQRVFQADRTLIFRLDSDHSGVVIKEMVRPAYPITLEMRWEDECFPPECYAAYAQGMARIVSDVALDTWGECLVDFMRDTQVQSKMVAPILQGQADGTSRVWGLLITHACATPRQWQPEELNLLQQVAEQLAIAVYQAELHQQLQTTNQELEHLSNTDALTQVANRRCFDQTLTQEWRRAQREQTSLALILCDIDHFKQYNDTYGHPAGDGCLIAVTQALQTCVNRATDCLARCGGEEFGIILPQTDVQGAIAVVQNMQAAIANLQLDHPTQPNASPITLSFGIVATLPSTTSSPEALIQQVDKALYQAKQTGRDRFCIAS